eukprot:tig00000254_g22465.t1
MNAFVTPAVPAAARGAVATSDAVASHPAARGRAARSTGASRLSPTVPPHSEFLGAPIHFRASARARGIAPAPPAGPSCMAKGDKKAAERSDDEERLAALPEFDDWLRSRGVPQQSVRIVQTELDGLGCAAAKDVPEGGTLISIPYENIITYETAMSSKLGDALQNVSEWTALALFLIHERFCNPGSEWAPYIHILRPAPPARTPHASASASAAAAAAALDRAAPPHACCPRASRPPSPGPRTSSRSNSAARPSSCAPGSAPPPSTTSSQCSRRPSSRSTRSCDLTWPKLGLAELAADRALIDGRFTFFPELRGGAGQLALVPVGDCANHRQDARAQLQYDEETESIVLVADRPYKKGQPVHVNYGELSNSGREPGRGGG